MTHDTFIAIDLPGKLAFEVAIKYEPHDQKAADHRTRDAPRDRPDPLRVLGSLDGLDQEYWLGMNCRRMAKKVGFIGMDRDFEMCLTSIALSNCLLHLILLLIE